MQQLQKPPDSVFLEVHIQIKGNRMLSPLAKNALWYRLHHHFEQLVFIGYRFFLRSLLKESLAEYLEGLAEDVNLAARDLWEKLRPLRTGTPSKKIKQFLKPLPYLKDKDGNSYQTINHANQKLWNMRVC